MMRMFSGTNFAKQCAQERPVESFYTCERCLERKKADQFMYNRGARSCTCLACQDLYDGRKSIFSLSKVTKGSRKAKNATKAPKAARKRRYVEVDV